MKLFQRIFGTATAVHDDFPTKDVAPISRREFLLEEISRFDQALRDHDQMVADFRARHFAWAGNSLAIRNTDGRDPGVVRREVEKQWKELLTDRQAIVDKRNNFLRELSRI